MLIPMERHDKLADTIEELLDGLASVHSTTQKRIALLSSLERCFGLAVLGQGVHGRSRDEQISIDPEQWWEAQAHPRSCVALALVSLLHRLHLQASMTSSVTLHPGQEITACCTILQGLCLKDAESASVCSSRSTLELLLAIFDAPYWSTEGICDDVEALTHAIDLLICITMASSRAAELFDRLDGEDVVRRVMTHHASNASDEVDGEQASTTGTKQMRRSIANKCTEFLLLFASERQEIATMGQSERPLLPRGASTSKLERRPAPLKLSPAKVRHASAGLPFATGESAQISGGLTKEDVIQRSRRARSSSPIKSMQRDKRVRSTASRQGSDAGSGLAVDSGGSINGGGSRSNSGSRRLSALMMIRTPTELEFPAGAYTASPLNRSPQRSFPPPSSSSGSNRLLSPGKRMRGGGFATPFSRPEGGTPASRSSQTGSILATTPSTVSSLDLQSTPSSSNGASPAVLRRGRSREREPLGAVRTPNPSESTLSPGKRSSLKNSEGTLLPIQSTDEPIFVSPSSPLKAIMGPSPAVQRAQARSTSPDKKRL